MLEEGGGERAGVRTLDLLIKSQLLYRLSYALRTLKALPEGGRNIGRYPPRVNSNINEKHAFGNVSTAPPFLPEGTERDQQCKRIRHVENSINLMRGRHGPDSPLRCTGDCHANWGSFLGSERLRYPGTGRMAER